MGMFFSKRNRLRCAALILMVALAVTCMAYCEEEHEEPEPHVLYVMSKELNGRIRPGKQYQKMATFDMWTPLKPTGRISKDRMWIEIETAENDYVWCNINYLTERREVIHVYTLWDEGIKIRSKPGEGKVTGIARKNQVLEITQVVMGYGRCDKGWVDLEYFIEDCE